MSDSLTTQARARLKQLASDAMRSGDSIGWFETLYQSAAGSEGMIPWAHLRADPLLVEWLASQRISGENRRALVVGSGLGDDAEELARCGFAVTAFDISAEAIRWSQRRFPGSPVHYMTANVLELPDEWRERFDLIAEIYTLQSLPDEALRAQAAANLARCLAPNGSLLAVCRAREQHEDRGTMPWPLTRAELAIFRRLGLREVAFEDLSHPEEPSVRLFRVEYTR